MLRPLAQQPQVASFQVEAEAAALLCRQEAAAALSPTVGEDPQGVAAVLRAVEGVDQPVEVALDRRAEAVEGVDQPVGVALDRRAEAVAGVDQPVGGGLCQVAAGGQRPLQ